MKYLIVVDMQKDFVTGSLGTPEAQAILPKVEEKIRGFDGKVVFTRDTHTEKYLSTQEGRFLPVRHCIFGEDGWELEGELEEICLKKQGVIFDKPSFGSLALAEFMRSESTIEDVESIELCGICTDICVVSNALILKAALPETPICLDASCCAGTTPENHAAAINTMKCCQIIIKE